MRVQFRPIILAFLAGAALVFAIAGVFLLVRSATDDGGNDAKATSPTPTNGPYPVLPDGQFIDSLPHVNTIATDLHPVPLTYFASQTGAIAVVEITGIVDSVVPSPGPGSRTPTIRRFQPLPWTTYSARVEQWIKGGNGETETQITEIGGLDYDGPRLLTGTFLLQIGRKYLLSLDPATDETPGPGNYQGASSGWGCFEVTDGFVHVLNEKQSTQLMGAYNGMSLDEFIAAVREWMIAPPAVTPTSPPTPAATP